MKENDKQILEDIIDILKEVIQIKVSFNDNLLTKIDRVRKKLRKSWEEE